MARIISNPFCIVGAGEYSQTWTLFDPPHIRTVEVRIHYVPRSLSGDLTHWNIGVVRSDGRVEWVESTNGNRKAAERWAQQVARNELTGQ